MQRVKTALERAQSVVMKEYRFVDPAKWDGVGEVIEDPELIADARQVLGVDLSYAIEVQRSRGVEPPPAIVDVANKYGPTEKRTMLVRIQVAGPVGEN
jgi:hypothetical protein